MPTTVLLIDDDIEEHELFAHQLAEYDNTMQLISAYDGVEALAMLENILPNHIFIDINMPKLNGLEVLKKLKQNKSLKDVPVYIYSTSDGFHSKQPAMALGAVYYFMKPTDPHGLYKIFKTVFNHK